MRPRNRIFVLGGAHTDFLGRARPEFVHPRHPEWGQRSNPSLEQHLSAATHATLETTGVAAEAIDRAFVSNFLGECFARQGHLGAMLAAVEPGLGGKPITRIEAACASGAASIVAAIEALQGSASVALAVGVEVENTVRSRTGVEYMAYAAHYERQRELEFAGTTPPLRAARSHPVLRPRGRDPGHRKTFIKVRRGNSFVKIRP